MRTSVVLALTGAALALASPLNVLKRAMETEVVVELTTLYVTETAEPTFFFANAHHHSRTRKSSSLTPSTTPTPTPTPTPSPTSTPNLVTKVPETTVAPALTSVVETTVAPAPAPVVDTTVVQEPVPTVVAADPAPVATQQVQPAQPSDYVSTGIYHHNVHRLNHSAPAMGWDATYASYAAITAKTCDFKHDTATGGGGYGQNLAMSGSSDLSGVTAASAFAQHISDMWYTEMPSFPQSGYGQATPDMGNFEAWGHFSQMVWVGSTSLGCATQLCPKMIAGMDAYFTVCNYFPAGNVGGGYGANVKPPLGQATVFV